MLVIISISVSILILVLLSHYSRQRSQSHQRNHQQIHSLRQVLELCRQHRDLTHHAIATEHNESTTQTIDQLKQQLTLESSKLIGLAHFDSKPQYRMLQRKLTGMCEGCQQRSFARNQRIHGTAIRHCLFLIDDIALTWLLDSGREDLCDEYQLNWQQVLDSMEVLTQLRICIPEVGQPSGEMRIKYNANKIRHKLLQLSLINSLPINSPLGNHLFDTLDMLLQADKITLNQNQLYYLTTDISRLISQVYDQMLSDIMQSLYQPLADIPSAESKKAT
ncbi:hypothetical protein H2O73_06510 [Vibrio sp. 404]|uniref:Nitrate/nitrite sensing protein domain-containing protein n=1 Tax=Vibrio marinisediminis TaxID=2758441 RepID=A0A7W2FQ02_9VIBR|nr:hypothetical protein [Vibrio marinisediminis]MBA5761997.1 hypothetical protein [Vibrio marinisediminis]